MKDFYQVNNLWGKQSRIPLDYTDTEWQLIDYYKKSIYKLKNNKILTDDDYKKLLSFPGFILLNDNKDISLYSVFYKKHLSHLFSPPRGCLDSGIVIIGYRPSEYCNRIIKSESCWYFGPSSLLLTKLCADVKILPYFTNFYKEAPNKTKIEYFYNESKLLQDNFSLLSQELDILSQLNNNKLKIICLGYFKEYDLLNNFYTVHKIWHPAYLLRKGNNKQLYNTWKSNLLLYLK